MVKACGKYLYIYKEKLFPFKKPLTSRYRKKYVEFLALGILPYCYGDTYAGFDVYDEPGLAYPVKDSDSEKEIFQDAVRKKTEKLENCFDEVLNEYRDKYDVIHFGFSCGLIEYDILQNSI